MKLSQILCRHNNYRLFKNKYAIKSSRHIIENPGLVAQVTQNGFTIEEALVAANPAPVLPIVPIPEPWGPPPVLDSTHPKWKPKICHTLYCGTKLLEGHVQGQIITKTVTYKGLPKRIQDMVGVLDSPDQDKLVQRAIFLSQMWDGWQMKLPREIDFNHIGFRKARTFGIPVGRSIKILLRNLIKLMESQTSGYEDALHRTHLVDAKAIVTMSKDDDLIKFDMKGDLLVTSRSPLEPFATSEEVVATTTAELPDIFPMKCTIDLAQTNIYDVQNIYPLSKSAANPYVHTIYVRQREPPPNWTETQALNRGMMECFTFAAAQAKALFGENVKTLSHPISVQCVLSTPQKMYLIAYQLNTLDLDSIDSVRNMAWIESDMKLYDRCVEKEGRVFFEGYNPAVYKNLLALHMNGLSAPKRAPLHAPPPPTITPTTLKVGL